MTREQRLEEALKYISEALPNSPKHCDWQIYSDHLRDTARKALAPTLAEQAQEAWKKLADLNLYTNECKVTEDLYTEIVDFLKRVAAGETDGQ